MLCFLCHGCTCSVEVRIMKMLPFASVGILLLAPYVFGDGYGHGVIMVKDCTAANLGYNQELYREDIMGINQAALYYAQAHPHYAMRSIADYMDNVYLNQPVELAHCLRDLGIDPSSVAQVSPLAWEALTYDRAQLKGFSPNFVNEIPAPGMQGLGDMVHAQDKTAETSAPPVQTFQGPAVALGEKPAAVSPQGQESGMFPSLYLILVAAIACPVVMAYFIRTRRGKAPVPVCHGIV